MHPKTLLVLEKWRILSDFSPLCLYFFMKTSSFLKNGLYVRNQGLTSPRKENVSYPAILEYLSQLSQVYFKSDLKKKSQLLDDAVQITGFHRKSLVRSLCSARPPSPGAKKRSAGARPLYPEALLLPHIEYLWNCMERISARRMKAAFKDWLPKYRQNSVDNHVKYLLQKMSVSTLDRFLGTLRKCYRGLFLGRFFHISRQAHEKQSSHQHPGFEYHAPQPYPGRYRGSLRRQANRGIYKFDHHHRHAFNMD